MAVKLHKRNTNVDAALQDGYSLLAELRDECREQYENMSEGFQNGDRGQVINQAADDLDRNCDETPWSGLPEWAMKREIEYGSNQRKNQSRQDRLDEALRMIQAATDSLTEAAEGEEGTEEERSNIESAVETIGEHYSEFEGVSFS